MKRTQKINSKKKISNLLVYKKINITICIEICMRSRRNFIFVHYTYIYMLHKKIVVYPKEM